MTFLSTRIKKINLLKQMLGGCSTDNGMPKNDIFLVLFFTVSLWGAGEKNLSSSGGGSVKQEYLCEKIRL